MMEENRQVLIDSLPGGKLEITNYKLHQSPVPVAGDGEVLCRTLWVTVAAGARAGLQGSASYAGAPKTGVVMNGAAVATVVASQALGFSEGDLVICNAGWQDYSVHSASVLQKIEGSVDPVHHLGVLGTNGVTAYFGLLDIGKPKAGETVLVSACGGSVGHIVAQLAKLKGCRVVGTAGSDAKAQKLQAQLGIDAVVNYKSPDFRQLLKEATPNGIDVYFDNTGGDILGSALFRMNEHGRIACCGVVSQYDTSSPSPGPKGIPGLLVNKRITMRGFLVFDYKERYDEAKKQLSEWIVSGKLTPLVDEVIGLENAPDAFVDLLAGGNIGTRVIRVSE
jgi:NADPH-dependent curcumin reductase CurA